MSRCSLTRTWAALAVSLPLAAHAQPSEAEQLFREAKAEVERGELASACPKLARSWELSAVKGALLSWADCEERRGDRALALQLWRQGAALVADEPERAAYVRARIDALERAVAVVEPPTPPPSAEQPPPAVAPGPPAPAPGQPEASGPSALVIAGWIAGGLGLAGGVAFGATGGAVLATCEDGRCPAEYEGVLIGNAVGATIGGVGLALGAALLGVGYASDGASGAPASADVRLSPGPGELGLGLGVSF